MHALDMGCGTDLLSTCRRTVQPFSGLWRRPGQSRARCMPWTWAVAQACSAWQPHALGPAAWWPATLHQPLCEVARRVRSPLESFSSRILVHGFRAGCGSQAHDGSQIHDGSRALWGQQRGGLQSAPAPVRRGTQGAQSAQVLSGRIYDGNQTVETWHVDRTQWLAARAGASSVVACDLHQPLCEVARRVRSPPELEGLEQQDPDAQLGSARWCQQRGGLRPAPDPVRGGAQDATVRLRYRIQSSRMLLQHVGS